MELEKVMIRLSSYKHHVTVLVDGQRWQAIRGNGNNEGQESMQKIAMLITYFWIVQWRNV